MTLLNSYHNRRVGLLGHWYEHERIACAVKPDPGHDVETKIVLFDSLQAAFLRSASEDRGGRDESGCWTGHPAASIAAFASPCGSTICAQPDLAVQSS